MLLVLSGGCSASKTIPTFTPISKISARVYSVPDLSVMPINNVDVPDDQISSFFTQIKPTKLCDSQIKKEMHYHIADVYIHHTDDTVTTLIIRWTGKNPAAVSLDDRVYYWGGMDEFPDGALNIYRLLSIYNEESRKIMINFK